MLFMVLHESRFEMCFLLLFRYFLLFTTFTFFAFPFSLFAFKGFLFEKNNFPDVEGFFSRIHFD